MLIGEADRFRYVPLYCDVTSHSAAGAWCSDQRGAFKLGLGSTEAEGESCGRRSEVRVRGV